MTDKQKQALLGVARKVITATVKGQAVSEFESEDPLFNQQLGCFVTIHNHGQLRGCIGNFTADKPLITMIRQMAIAATQDYRFLHNPVTAKELDEIDIEISVLGPLELTADPLSLQLGRNGIYIRRGRTSGCYLPQVATETGWTKEQFLARCCSDKAGLPADAWQKSDTEVYLFDAEVFGEKDFK